MHASSHQLQAIASADTTTPPESTAGALSSLKSLATLAFALNPRSAFAVSEVNMPFTSPTLASCSSVGMIRSGAAPQAIVGHLVKESKKKDRKQLAKWQIKGKQAVKADFLGGFRLPKDMPRLKLPEVTFAGRSNVGKSSALNQLVGGRQTKLAVTSKTPGRTRLINLFKIGKLCSVTDLPGYGFAKVSDELLDKWKSGITAYLRHREDLRLCVLLVDAQREPQPMDAQLLDFLEEENVPALVVATKIDKVKDRDRQKNLHRLYESLALPEGQPIPFSGTTGEGRDEVWQKIAEMCQEEGPDAELQLKLRPESYDDDDEDELLTAF